MITVSLHKYYDDAEVFSMEPKQCSIKRAIYVCAKKFRNPERKNYYVLVKDNGWEIEQHDADFYISNAHGI